MKSTNSRHVCRDLYRLIFIYRFMSAVKLSCLVWLLDYWKINRYQLRLLHRRLSHHLSNLISSWHCGLFILTRSCEKPLNCHYLPFFSFVFNSCCLEVRDIKHRSKHMLMLNMTGQAVAPHLPCVRCHKKGKLTEKLQPRKCSLFWWFRNLFAYG